MDNQAVTVVYKPLRSNLINLPSHLANLLYSANISIQEVVAELTFKPKPNLPLEYAYAGWTGMATTSTQSATIEIDSAFAQSLGLANAARATLSLKLKHAEATTIHLEPVSSSDWEVVELHAQLLEDKLLSQSRCVKLGQVLVVYPTTGTTALLVVTKIEPAAETYAKISPNCEVMVAPKVKQKKKRTVKERARAEPLPSVLLRGIALPHALFPDSTAHPGFEVFVDFDSVAHRLGGAEYVTVATLPGPKPVEKEPRSEPETPAPGELTEAKRVVAKLVHYSDTPEGHVGLSETLAVALAAEASIGNIVVLQKAAPPIKLPTLVFHPYATKSPALTLSLNSTDKQKEEMRAEKTRKVEAIKAQVSGWGVTPVTNFTRVAPLEELLLGGLLEFKRCGEGWAPSGETKVDIGEDLIRGESFVVRIRAEEHDDTVGMAPLIEKIQTTVMRGNVGALVYGASGSGKTAVVRDVAAGLRARGVFTRTVLCDTLANESFNAAKTALTAWVTEASWYAPLCLVLENVENILPAELEHADGTQSNQLAEFLATQLSRVGQLRNVSIICTTKSKESVNKLLFQLHTVEETFNLKTPDKELRRLVLEAHMAKLGMALKFDIMDVVAETEGYLPNDLKILLDRVYHELLFNTEGASVLVTQKEFGKTIEGYTPSNLRGVKLQKSTINWSDIGGLEEAKTILLETLEWPTKYAPIFQSCPLRLRSGILLYGYPGCGKTLLASAIAGACGLNFISIKGPEILNKYIGASEQSVRELFERASSAKPCILFFDEFDSIAPKRGHDSTGVTDRVVNQMLTQMDGAEGLDGVYVLAATSRPDLIDSALLRPGRLDKSVICDMPSRLDRLSILQSITRKMELMDEVDLDEVAGRTAGYSGADLQGLGYNAYLKAVHQKLEKDENALVGVLEVDKKAHEFFQIKQNKEKMRNTDRVKVLHKIEQLFDNMELEAGEGTETEAKTQEAVKVYISRQDFLDSLEETKLSISVSEKTKLQRIYSEFLSGRDGNMPDGSTSNEVGGRTTLM
ncbi:hypothetical protein BABINDRAFT_159248 [Babjeviella inositovora NRRL Y-12698]|uniref:Peroxisomal ATPase PEX1 n=1 Tax=Babjeviella inositovora NRRL Y-12698 TaxID=984486 RepID=A0A1E3QYH5_9ASCO|nr:uncharacterized protein BABINDRAFT_159248 [Babjeviella inositovora NRRL Y-12698]ODQ82729.1 hypothetical protein BABINDRAFT_159248 [Babjeviella inositovora NRRL Y-12698]